jgi:D-cysteine desulfhydrase
VRKLEFVLADALRKGADTVITTGGIGSNHARATAVAARQLGLHPHLVLRGQPGPAPDGNLLLDALLNADITFISREEYERRDEIMSQMAEELRKKGYCPYIIPEGASNEIGVWGYVYAAREIIQQQEREHLPEFDAVVCATGSGGTQAGLLIGLRAYGRKWPVYGINVCDDARYFQKRIGELLEKFRERYHQPTYVTEDDIQLIDGYVGEGYSRSRPEELELIKLVARLEGIFLDPTYTGKAMYGLVDQIEKGRFKEKQNILFIHTGGIFSLFPKRATFMGGPDVGEFYDDGK